MGALSQGGASSRLQPQEGGRDRAGRGGRRNWRWAGPAQPAPRSSAPSECRRAENQGSAEVLEVSASSTWSCPHGALRELHKEGDERKFGWRIKAQGCFQGLLFS